MSSPLNEDKLVQETTADYLQHNLGWDENIYAMRELLGPEGTLGRKSEKQVVLTRYLSKALIWLNPDLPDAAYQDALRQVTEASVTHGTLQINREKYELIKKGVLVQYRDSMNELVRKRLRVIDFESPDNNHFLCVREMWIRGHLYRRRADILGFVNGLPLLFLECKALHKDIRRAYDENLADYKDTIPHLFHHNAFVVLGNGVEAKIGSLSSSWEHFSDWKRLHESDPGVVDMETLLKGVCDKQNFLDLFENFILFDESPHGLTKIVARNHQFLGVNQAISATRDRKVRIGKLGVFWHTQGSGKSYSMVFYTRKIHRKMGANYTFVICTDRTDLDGQLYKTFAGCGLVDNDKNPCRADSGRGLREMLAQHKSYIFTLIQKFNEKLGEDEFYSDRNDIIIITDEAHRTQYGTLSLNLRNALPNASRIGFTGTPLFMDDEITRRVFGEYVSKYDFQRAVEDGATVPLYYDARGEALQVVTNDLNEKIAAKLEELEIEDQDVSERLERDLKRDYHVITNPDRLDKIAQDFVVHYSTQWETGKAMLVCIDKITAVKMHALLVDHWNKRIIALDAELASCDEQEKDDRERQLDWMRETLMAVVISEEQGEVAKFANWDLDIKPHRKLIKDGFETEDGKRLDVESAFKKEEHPFRVAIICAMWMTGFDVPCMSTLYLDKPLKAHTLMQAIARANRVHEGKNNGLIVDYCGILKSLRKALSTFAGHTGVDSGDEPHPETDPVKPDAELLTDLEEAIEAVRSFLDAKGVALSDILSKAGFERNKAIVDTKEVVNENDKSRKRFQILCREVFKKFKACLNLREVNRYRNDRDAINVIYKSLEEDVKKADISDIIKELHAVVGEAVEVSVSDGEDGKLFDISRIDFKRLRKEFAHVSHKNTTVQNLKEAVERRLKALLQANPTRTNFQMHYEMIVSEYNDEKNRVTIEQTFDALLKLVEDLDVEKQRAVREGLGGEETLALYDLLIKPDLAAKDIKKLKKVATGLHEVLSAEVARVQDFYAKQATRDYIKTRIHDYLYDDESGLPESFEVHEIDKKTEIVFTHLMQGALHSSTAPAHSHSP